MKEWYLELYKSSRPRQTALYKQWRQAFRDSGERLFAGFSDVLGLHFLAASKKQVEMFRREMDTNAHTQNPFPRDDGEPGTISKWELFAGVDKSSADKALHVFDRHGRLVAEYSASSDRSHLFTLQPCPLTLKYLLLPP